MFDEKRKQLAKVSYLYFIEGKTQAEIAKMLGVYRTTVSRMISQAKKEGIVEIKIADYGEELFLLESYIKEKYGLKKIELVPSEVSDSNEEKDEKLALAASEFMKKNIRTNDVVGLSWGATLWRAIDKINGKYDKNATIVPIVGGPSHINANFHVNTLVYELSRRFEGESLFINATVVQETKLLKEGIVASKYFSELKDKWKQLDIAFVGIGGQLSYKKSQWRDLLTSKDFEDLKLREAVGDCCCHFFDKDGKILKGDLDDRTIGLSLEELANVPLSVGIARGKVKARAIASVLKGKYVNCLVSDQETMLELLRLEKDTGYAELINHQSI